MFQWWGFPGVASLSKLLTLTKSSADQKEHQAISHICQTNKQKNPSSSWCSSRPLGKYSVQCKTKIEFFGSFESYYIWLKNITPTRKHGAGSVMVWGYFIALGPEWLALSVIGNTSASLPLINFKKQC